MPRQKDAIHPTVQNLDTIIENLKNARRIVKIGYLSQSKQMTKIGLDALEAERNNLTDLLNGEVRS